MTQAFWKPRPIPPDEDWIGPLLRWSLWVSAVGWIVYGLFAFAFDDIRVIPATVQSWMVVIGSALIVAGAEMNTAPTSVAVFRKLGSDKASKLDILALIASFVGSVIAALITFSIRQSLLGESKWRLWSLSIGPLIAGIAVAADYYAASAELGLLKSDYEREMTQWLAEEQQWNQEHGITEPINRSSWREAVLDDARVLAGRLDGERSLVKDDDLQQWFDRLELRVPEQSLSTRHRWGEVLRNGG